MHILLFMAGLVWIVWGAIIFGIAKGGIHEVYAAICVSFGVLFLGFAELLRRLRELGLDQHRSATSYMPPAPAEDYWRPSQAAQDLINSGH